MYICYQLDILIRLILTMGTNTSYLDNSTDKLCFDKYNNKSTTTA